MHQVARYLEYALIVWFFLLAALVAMRTLSGDIMSSGFLSDKPGEGTAPERAVMMAVFPAVLVAYAYNALTGDIPIINGRPSLPEVPQTLLALLTGSNSLYLAGKIARR